MNNLRITLGVLAISVISLSSCKEAKKEQNGEHENHSEMNHDNGEAHHEEAKKTTSMNNPQDGNVDAILNDYLNLKDALVADDNAKAKKLGASMANSLGSLDITNYADDQKSELKDIIEDGKGHAEQIAESAIDIQREHFKVLSKEVKDLVAIAGTDRKLYEQFCPMYDNGTAWLSTSKEIQNPYYGSKMLTCGKVQNEIN